MASFVCDEARMNVVTMRLGLSILLAPLLVAQASDSTFYRDQAEADSSLARFDRDNPRCRLWTNWQKMCSRTGRHGTTLCVDDPGRRVAPSEPFCTSGAGYAWPSSDPSSLSGAQSISLHRFCSPESAAVGPMGDKIEECGFSEARPFNGLRLAARLHPWCRQWNEAITMKPVCRTGRARGALPRCGELAAAQFVSRRGFYCARSSIPAWCGEAEGLGVEASYPKKGDIIPVAERQSAFAVRGISCREKE
jgi:hypothetical protein